MFLSVLWSQSWPLWHFFVLFCFWTRDSIQDPTCHSLSVCVSLVFCILEWFLCLLWHWHLREQASWVQLCTPVVPAVWEDEAGGMQLQGLPGQLSKTFLKIKSKQLCFIKPLVLSLSGVSSVVLGLHTFSRILREWPCTLLGGFTCYFVPLLMI